MRVAILSDIHANLSAFESVIADWGDVDAVWCLGDVVGYGPDPVACLDRLRSLTTVCVAGNHDWAATGRLDTAGFNDLAAEAAVWTSQQLSLEALAYLDALPQTVTVGEFTLVHGSPRYPIWEYVTSAQAAGENFSYFAGSACFIGHSHVPRAFTLTSVTDDDAWEIHSEAATYDRPSDLGDKRHLINVGSVGQPRDGDPRARYVILDTDGRRYWRRRVSYDIAETQDRMRRARLPRLLWQRLEVGQ